MTANLDSDSKQNQGTVSGDQAEMSPLEAWWERRSPLGSGQGRDSLHSDTLKGAFPELNGQAPYVSPLRLEHLALRGPRGCCVEGQNSPPPGAAHPTAILLSSGSAPVGVSPAPAPRSLAPALHQIKTQGDQQT